MTGKESGTGCCRDLREELRVKCFGLSHGNPSLFVIPQCFHPRFYPPWSIFWTLFHVAMLMLDIYYNKDLSGRYLIFLTNWTYIFQTVTVLLDTIVTLHVHINRGDIKTELTTECPWYMKVLWLMYNITNTISILVTLLYYALLTPDFSHGSTNKHLINSIYVLLNLAFSAKPVQILHFYQPMIYAALYLIFTLIYYGAGADPIYEIIDWSKAGTTVLVSILVLVLAVPICHMFCFALYTFRVYVYTKCCRRSKINGEHERKAELPVREKTELSARDVNVPI